MAAVAPYIPAPATATFARMSSFGKCSLRCGLVRRILHGSLDDGHEQAFANPIIHIAPTNAATPESQQPNYKRGGVPQDNERHFFPKAVLLEPPNSDEPGDQHAKEKICAHIAESDGGRMSERNRKTPRQSLRESEPEMPPWAHVAHDGHPAKTLDEKVFQGIVVWDGTDGVWKQLDFETLLGNQAANEKIVSGTILDGLVAAESGKVLARGDDRLTESEL